MYRDVPILPASCAPEKMVVNRSDLIDIYLRRQKQKQLKELRGASLSDGFVRMNNENNGILILLSREAACYVSRLFQTE